MAQATESIEPVSQVPPDVLDRVMSFQRPVVVGHVRPDVDCLGSMFAVALAFPGADQNKARVSLPAGSLSQRLAFLAEWADVPVATRQDFVAADGFVVVDTAKFSRCNVDRALGDFAAGRDVVNIDHHLSNTRFGSHNWVDDRSGSAAELVYHLVRAAGCDPDPLIASLLFAGIHSDTIGFSLPTTSASALRAAAELVKAGARVGEIGRRLCRSHSPGEFQLLRIIYDNTRTVAGGKVAYSTATFEEISSTGCGAQDIDDQVAVPRSLDGAVVAFLLTEGTRGKVRLNLRGEAGIDVLGIAKALGGGGHAQAAGAILSGSIEEALDRVLKPVLAAVEALET